MSSNNLNNIIDELKAHPQEPSFYVRAFSLIAKQQKTVGDESQEVICVEEYDNLSKRLDRSLLQESCSVRNVLRTRRLAISLFNEKGDLILDKVADAIREFEKCIHSVGPNRQHDATRQEHILNVLRFLLSSKEAQRLLKAISKPISHRQAEEIIRAALQLPAKEMITDAHARQATLSAWLCYLRQNVGSCFATAPAIIVQNEQPLQFLKDINELLSTGRLKRTFGGIEYTVPLSISWGAGDLKKNVIIPINAEGEPEIELWLSPGLISALEAIGSIQKNISLKQKIDEAKVMILSALRIDSGQPYIIINAEEIIRRILLARLGLSESDVNEPVSIIEPSLLHLPRAGLSKGKAEARASYAHLFEFAQNAFKGIADNALLKAWEFTMASFAETKAGFTRWNLYSSLGFKHEEPGGIGYRMYEIIMHRIEEAKIRIKELQEEYETKYAHLKYLETRMQRASEKEIEWMKIDYKTRMYEFNTLQELRDAEQERGQRIADMFNMLTDAYYELFPKYFQEVYDADMHEVAVSQYDDSPAGFRLLFKHGRSNTSQWTYIHNAAEFIQALSDFFVATETELKSREEFKGLEKELSSIITSIVMHIKSDEFLESAFYRMAAAHNTRPVKNPLQNLDKIEKKPWAYTSGGSMATLVSCFFGLEDKPYEISRWVENPMELLVFLIDTLKQTPPKIMQDYIANPKKSMLIHSPTHAFLLKPGISPYKEAWLQDAFTYTWARDNLVKPSERFVDSLLLDEGMQDFVIEQLSELIPLNYRYYFRKSFGKIYGEMSSVQFREMVVDAFQKEKGLQNRKMPVLHPEEIDHFLYESLPIFPSFSLGDKVKEILENMPELSKKHVNLCLELWEKFPAYIGGERFSTAKTLQNTVKALICLTMQKTSSPFDIHSSVAEAARACGFAMPKPILFADTNWMKDYFGFTVSPGTGKLELWRFDLLGVEGYPMLSWTQWLDGSRKDIPWGVYTRPYEYLK